MLRIDLTKPFVSIAINRFGLLDRKVAKIFNRDNDIKDAATALLVEKYENETKVIFGEEEQSGLIAFFQWLIDNQDAIKAFIEMIMSLFNAENPKDKEYVL